MLKTVLFTVIVFVGVVATTNPNVVAKINKTHESYLLAVDKKPSAPGIDLQGEINGDVLEIPLQRSYTKLLVDLSSVKLTKDGTVFGRVGSGTAQLKGAEKTIMTIFKDTFFNCAKKEYKVTGGTFTVQTGDKVEVTPYDPPIKDKFVSTKDNPLADFELTLVCTLHEKEVEAAKEKKQPTAKPFTGKEA